MWKSRSYLGIYLEIKQVCTGKKSLRNFPVAPAAPATLDRISHVVHLYEAISRNNTQIRVMAFKKRNSYLDALTKGICFRTICLAISLQHKLHGKSSKHSLIVNMSHDVFVAVEPKSTFCNDNVTYVMLRFFSHVTLRSAAANILCVSKRFKRRFLPRFSQRETSSPEPARVIWNSPPPPPIA